MILFDCNLFVMAQSYTLCRSYSCIFLLKGGNLAESKKKTREKRKFNKKNYFVTFFVTKKNGIWATRPAAFDLTSEEGSFFHQFFGNAQN